MHRICRTGQSYINPVIPCKALKPRNLARHVVFCAEDGIAFSEERILGELRVDVFSHDFACGRNLKHPPEEAFDNQRIAVWQSPRT